MTSVYCKPTFSGVFTNFGSFILKLYKYNLLFTLLHRAFKLCSNFERLHQEIDKLKTIFENNSYPKCFDAHSYFFGFQLSVCFLGTCSSYIYIYIYIYKMRTMRILAPLGLNVESAFHHFIYRNMFLYNYFGLDYFWT